MLRFKHWIKNFFGFSRSQVNGFIILLPLVTVCIFSEPLWHWWISKRPVDFTADQAKLDSLVALWNPEKAENVNYDVQKPKFFTFDPNSISNEDFIDLGFSPNLASRITRYREKGGKFRIKSDLLKIYGLDSTFYRQLLPFIALPDQHQKIEKKKRFEKEKAFTVKKEVEKFDLNGADTTQLKKIYGVGDKLSLRIVKYRDIVGGFVAMDQLKEIYGLDSAVVNRLLEASFLDENFKPVRININTASEKQLAAHPYLKKAAKAIVAYRFQHGDFKTLEDIRNISSLEEKTIQKIRPYLKVNDE